MQQIHHIPNDSLQILVFILYFFFFFFCFSPACAMRFTFTFELCVSLGRFVFIWNHNAFVMLVLISNALRMRVKIKRGAMGLLCCRFCNEKNTVSHTVLLCQMENYVLICYVDKLFCRSFLLNQLRSVWMMLPIVTLTQC